MIAALRSLLRVLLLTLAAFGALGAHAHEMSMAELEVRETAPGEFLLVWLQSDRRPPAEELTAVWPKGCEADTGTLRCPGGLRGTLRMEGVGKTFSAALVKIHWLDGSSRVYPLTAAQRSVRLFALGEDDTMARAWAYVNLGIEHIVLGVDHLLFVLGLLLIVRQRWMLLKTITAFTVAHSITLAVATFGVAHVAAGPLNAAIALSILFLAPEVVRSWRGQTSFTIRHPWIVAFAFGLLHGFGFASGLVELGLAREQIPLALLMFNVGVEIGQLAFVALALLLRRALRLLQGDTPFLVERLPAYLIGTLGAMWTIQRVFLLFRGAL